MPRSVLSVRSELARRRRDHYFPAVAKDRIQRRLGQSLTELEDADWGEPPGDATGLIERVYALRQKPIGTMTDEDLRLLIGQHEGLLWHVPMAIERLQADPCASGDMYPGALYNQVARVPSGYWARHRDR